MKVRVGLYILLILFLLISGKEEARAGRYAAKGDTCRVSDRMNQPETWSKIYQWVMDDPQVPDKEDVLMLIRYHFGNFEKLRKLLRYLDGGRPYAIGTSVPEDRTDREDERQFAGSCINIACEYFAGGAIGNYSFRSLA